MSPSSHYLYYYVSHSLRRTIHQSICTYTYTYTLHRPSVSIRRLRSTLLPYTHTCSCNTSFSCSSSSYTTTTIHPFSNISSNNHIKDYKHTTQHIQPSPTSTTHHQYDDKHDAIHHHHMKQQSITPLIRHTDNILYQESTNEIYDLACIGSGIIGLACIRELMLRYGNGLKTILIDKEPQIASHQSSHNSGVIHAGKYTYIHTHTRTAMKERERTLF
jgi:hypothetical protein